MSGSLTLTGTSGADILTGGALSDTLSGLGGSDTLSGLGGADTLDGGAGADTLIGGAGADRLVGGADLDTFAWASLADANGDSISSTTSGAVSGGLEVGERLDFSATSLAWIGGGAFTGVAGQGGGGAATIGFSSGSVSTSLVFDTNGDRMADATLSLALPVVQASAMSYSFFSAPALVTRSFSAGLAETAPGSRILEVVGPSFQTGTAAADTLSGGVAADSLDGAGGNDLLLGGEGGDMLIGGAGDDTLDGGAGANILVGGEGRDTFVLRLSDFPQFFSGTVTVADFTGDDRLDLSALAGFTFIGTSAFTAANQVRVDASSSGTFIRLSTPMQGAPSSAYNTSASLQISPSALDLFETTPGSLILSNIPPGVVLNGTDSGDTLTGTEGSDIISGRGGDDVILGLGREDSLSGDGGNDTLVGGAGNDTLLGGEGNDLLNNDAGADALIGGTGDDVYFVNDGATTIAEDAGGGADTTFVSVTGYTLSANIETALLAGAAVALQGSATGESLFANATLGSTLAGNGGADTLVGGAGADTLQGGNGDDILVDAGAADRMEGGAGNDIFVVSVAGSQVAEATGGGTDTAFFTAAGTWSLATHVETGVVTTAGASLTATQAGQTIASFAAGGVFLTAAAAGGTLWGSAAAGDTLQGGAGNDVLGGQGGGDTLRGGAGDDLYLIGAAGDIVVELPGGGTDVAFAEVDGWTAAIGIETAVLLGTARVLSGTGGQTLVANATLGSTLTGAAGQDVLAGGAGADVLKGGLGDDLLTGGAGADRFVFDAAGWGSDNIFDAQVGDVLDFRGSGLSGIGAFTAVEFADPFVTIFTSAAGNVNVWGMTRAQAEAAMIFA